MNDTLTPVTAEAFAKMMALMTSAPEKFQPSATYDPDGDCIEFIAKPDSFYAERYDELVTVYYSHDTNDVVGSLVKGVKKLTRDLLASAPGIQIVIQGRKVKMVHLFLARLFLSKPDPSEMKTLTYRKLLEVAEESGVEAELCPA